MTTPIYTLPFLSPPKGLHMPILESYHLDQTFVIVSFRTKQTIKRFEGAPSWVWNRTNLQDWLLMNDYVRLGGRHDDKVLYAWEGDRDFLEQLEWAPQQLEFEI